MTDKESIDKQLKESLDDKSERWNFANDILYKMCKENPKHENEHVIVAKIWLIGRSYAAAIERTEKARESNDFYYEKVVKLLETKIHDELEIHDELDRIIAELNNGEKYERLSRDNLDEALEAHNFLMKEFNKITGKDNRSLVSKYLHFHCPSMFYIYDTRAVSAINEITVKMKEKSKEFKELRKPDLEEGDYDKCYSDFCAKVLALQEYIEKEHGQKVTPRTIDSFLLHYYNRKIKRKIKPRLSPSSQ